MVTVSPQWIFIRVRLRFGADGGGVTDCRRRRKCGSTMPGAKHGKPVGRYGVFTPRRPSAGSRGNPSRHVQWLENAYATSHEPALPPLQSFVAYATKDGIRRRKVTLRGFAIGKFRSRRRPGRLENQGREPLRAVANASATATEERGARPFYIGPDGRMPTRSLPDSSGRHRRRMGLYRVVKFILVRLFGCNHDGVRESDSPCGYGPQAVRARHRAAGGLSQREGVERCHA